MIRYPNRISLDDQVQNNIIRRFGYQRPIVEINYPFTYRETIQSPSDSTVLSPRLLNFVPLPTFNNILLDENNLPYIAT